MINIFLGHFWIFELTHIVFELGHLNPINILNALIILKLVEGCWKYFQKCPQLFSTFYKMVWYFITKSKQRK